jgi:hypothetical protein
MSDEKGPEFPETLVPFSLLSKQQANKPTSGYKILLNQPG